MEISHNIMPYALNIHKKTLKKKRLWDKSHVPEKHLPVLSERSNFRLFYFETGSYSIDHADLILGAILLTQPSKC